MRHDDVMALILAGGRVPELEALTAQRTKAAVPFGGLYRVIDFPLTNLMRSEVGLVGVLSQYHPQSLIDHLGDGATWDFVGRRRALKLLPPYWGREHQDWYDGTADALWQNIDFIDEYDPELVLVLSGDHVYSMDYRPLLEFHRSKGADVTIVVKDVGQGAAHRYGVAELDAEGRVRGYEEKPTEPKSSLASLTIYVFNRRVLVEQLERRRPPRGQTYHVYRQILPEILASHRVFGYVFDGYWHYTRTIDDYVAAHRDLLGPNPSLPLADWLIETNLNDDGLGEMPPAICGATADVRNSLLGPGCWIAGRVESSIIAPGVEIEEGAVVRDSIVNHRCRIGRDAVVSWAVLDKDVVVGANARIEGDRDAPPNERSPRSLRCGVAVLGKRTRVPDGGRIEGNVIVCPGAVTPPLVSAGSTIDAVEG
ncbi:MAG: glucose-1-phosphate adenylyltransferase [Myxococcales bacterium]|nr:glucose-1-phosphate adenylyltransferase [Myxococcales bacterium]